MGGAILEQVTRNSIGHGRLSQSGFPTEDLEELEVAKHKQSSLVDKVIPGFKHGTRANVSSMETFFFRNFKHKHKATSPRIKIGHLNICFHQLI